MKKLVWLFVVFSTFFFSSCDNESPTSNSQNIVGKWEAVSEVYLYRGEVYDSYEYEYEETIWDFRHDGELRIVEQKKYYDVSFWEKDKDRLYLLWGDGVYEDSEVCIIEKLSLKEMVISLKYYDYEVMDTVECKITFMKYNRDIDYSNMETFD